MKYSECTVKELGKPCFCLFIKNMSVRRYVESGLPTDLACFKGRGILTVRR